MKINACDICLGEGKIVASGWTFKITKGFETMRVAVCADHKGTLKGKGYDAVLDIAVKAEQKYNDMAFANQGKVNENIIAKLKAERGA